MLVLEILSRNKNLKWKCILIIHFLYILTFRARFLKQNLKNNHSKMQNTKRVIKHDKSILLVISKVLKYTHHPIWLLKIAGALVFRFGWSSVCAVSYAFIYCLWYLDDLANSLFSWPYLYFFLCIFCFCASGSGIVLSKISLEDVCNSKLSPFLSIWMSTSSSWGLLVDETLITHQEAYLIEQKPWIT